MSEIKTVASAIGESIPAVGNLFDMVENIIDEGVANIVETFMGLAESIAGDTALPDGFDMEITTMDAFQNFIDAAGISNSLIDGVIDGVSSFVDENAGDILGYIGALLTAFSLIYAVGFCGGAARLGSIIVGSISAAL